MAQQHDQGTSDAAGDAYVSIKAACERFGISRSGVYELIRQHGLQRYRKAFDSRTYVSLADLQAARAKMPSQQRELIR